MSVPRHRQTRICTRLQTCVLRLRGPQVDHGRLDRGDERIPHDVSLRVRDPDGRSYPYSDATGSVTPLDDGEANRLNVTAH
jgi:hypothetical protein